MFFAMVICLSITIVCLLCNLKSFEIFSGNLSQMKSTIKMKFLLVGLILYISVNSYGHVETVSSPYHTFSWASLT